LPVGVASHRLKAKAAPDGDGTIDIKFVDFGGQELVASQTDSLARAFGSVRMEPTAPSASSTPSSSTDRRGWLQVPEDQLQWIKEQFKAEIKEEMKEELLAEIKGQIKEDVLAELAPLIAASHD